MSQSKVERPQADDNEAAHERLREVQHLLCDLVETLDAQRTRYTRDLERA
jgi:hypothetical protein